MLERGEGRKEGSRWSRDIARLRGRLWTGPGNDDSDTPASDLVLPRCVRAGGVKGDANQPGSLGDGCRSNLLHFTRRHRTVKAGRCCGWGSASFSLFWKECKNRGMWNCGNAAASIDFVELGIRQGERDSSSP